MVLCSGLSKFVLFCVILTSRVAAFKIAKPGCQEKCGDVSIPYPFGLTKECSLNEDYLLSCDSATTHPKVFLTNTKVEVLNISLDGYLRILTNVGRDCYNSKGWRDVSQSNALTSMYKYPVSNTRNKFVAIGCDTNARISFSTNDMERVFSACSSLCYSERYVSEGTCSGTGCCETSIPRDVYNYTVSVTSFHNHANVWKFNPCSYTFVGEVDKSFKLSMSHLENFTNITVPTVLDWAVGNQTCKEAMSNMSTYACQSNSECIGPDNGYGYRCNCTDGYEGNPYLHGSCQDINECEDGKPNNCEKICINTDGGYTCKCPKSHSGDGKRGGQGCIPNESIMIKIIVDVGIGTGLLVLVICSFWLYWVYKKKKLLQLKNKYFKQNGGLMLQQQLLKQQGCTETAMIYTAEELEKATDKYDESRIVGQGGFGTVYKGILANGSVVAIKRSKLVDKNQIEQFINGVVVLYQINHRNVVRLLGCCLETEVPLLVYEYVSNGTLFDHIHVENMNSTTSVLPWNIRVRIAAQIAGVLAYLHSVASPPIIHRDVKSTNILLDENYVAKVSDFGASRLVPIDQIVLSTFVQGTLGYLDPEYLLTRQLTEKSDVYSFGVVLVELLTGKKNLCFDSVEKERSLANYILACLKQDRLHEILEESLKEEKLEQIEEVAKIAKICLRMRGDDRPDMQEVAMRLEGLRRIIERENRQWVDPGSYLEEAPSLLLEDDEELSDIFNKFGHGGNGSSSVYDSIQDHVVLSVNNSWSYRGL